ncbi:MAG: 30S ribosomal protein S24e [Candidatus Methanodesulfokora sp.]|jgi:ribosomal protein S24E|nr:MAG: 30S ribosomal protein S24e [Candidatus Korarchaeota archaeon]
MNILSMEKRENKLLNRVEVIARVGFPGGTPKRAEIREEISKRLGKPVDLVFIRKIITEYGKREALVTATVYNRKEDALKFEPAHIIKRNEKGKEESK